MYYYYYYYYCFNNNNNNNNNNNLLYCRWASSCSRRSATTTSCIKSPAVSSVRSSWPAAAAAAQGSNGEWPGADRVHRSSIYNRTHRCIGRHLRVTRRSDAIYQAALASTTTRCRDGDWLYVELVTTQQRWPYASLVASGIALLSIAMRCYWALFLTYAQAAQATA